MIKKKKKLSNKPSPAIINHDIIRGMSSLEYELILFGNKIKYSVATLIEIVIRLVVNFKRRATLEITEVDKFNNSDLTCFNDKQYYSPLPSH